MRPLQAQQNASEGHQAFTEVVEDWLLRPRNPHADEAILDAVQRRQERQDDAQRAHTTSADNETHATPSTAVVSAAQLVKLQGEQPCETWLLPSGRPVLVGRSGHKTSSLDVNLWPDMSVSRRHALIWFDGEGWYIEDLQSTNGTVLGDSNIRGQHAIRLALGTKIQFGRTVLMLTALAPESAESAQASTDGTSAD
jgi:FHA domain